MPLVAYSDSEDSTSDGNSKPNIGNLPVSVKGLKRTRKRKLDEEDRPSDLPPLPDSFHDLYSSTVRFSNQDDPSLHAGRQRQTPHIEGQWPTHVYIEWHPSRSETKTLTNILTDIGKTLPPNVQLHSLLKSDLGAGLPLHISLSRTLPLATHQRQPFTESLQTAVQESAVKPFTVTSDGLRWTANYEKNRWFLVVPIKKPPGDELNRLLGATNRVAQKYDKPCLYLAQNSLAAPVTVTRWQPSTEKHGGSNTVSSTFGVGLGEPYPHMYDDMSAHFHISIGWTLEEPVANLAEAIVDKGSQGAIKLELAIETVKARIGNGVVVVPLAPKTAQTNGIVGL
ncbi:MAG: hypothetical protein Q9178_005471 [Gyalolechia marmorata]